MLFNVCCLTISHYSINLLHRAHEQAPFAEVTHWSISDPSHYPTDLLFHNRVSESTGRGDGSQHSTEQRQRKEENSHKTIQQCHGSAGRRLRLRSPHLPVNISLGRSCRGRLKRQPRGHNWRVVHDAGSWGKGKLTWLRQNKKPGGCWVRTAGTLGSPLPARKHPWKLNAAPEKQCMEMCWVSGDKEPLSSLLNISAELTAPAM